MVPDIEDLVREVTLRHPANDAHHAFHDVVNKGEVTHHVAVIEDLDRASGEDRVREEPGSHIGASPGAVHGEEAETGERKLIEVRVARGHQFIRFLRRRVVAHRKVDAVVFRKRHLFILSVDGGGARENEVPDLVVPAAFEEIREPDEV